MPRQRLMSAGRNSGYFGVHAPSSGGSPSLPWASMAKGRDLCRWIASLAVTENGRNLRRSALYRQQRPQVEVEQHGGVVLIADLEGEARGGLVLQRHEPQPQRATSGRPIRALSSTSL